ncbi:MAG: hypothetical protein K2X81_27495 [Candidatus Obscuribacterales bacterium]|nr:hypothetical protein [Candidatus Obscuribacterales bacterium]
MNRLETIAPNLYKMLREVDAAKLQSLKMAACNYINPVLDQFPNDIISQAKAELMERGKLSKTIREELETLAYSFDEQYYPIYEANPGNESAYMPFFTQARAINAVSYAGEADSIESAVEAIYEAAQAVKNRKVFLEYLESLAETTIRHEMP